MINKGLSSCSIDPEDRLFTIFQNTTTQKVVVVEAYPEIRGIVRDIDGNMFAEFNVPERIDPGSNLTIRIRMKITLLRRKIPQNVSIALSGSIYDIPSGLSNYTIPIGAWNYKDESMKHIADLALRLKGDDENVLRIVLKIVKYIGENVEYPEGESLRLPQYPNQTLLPSGVKGKGDCDDQAALMVAILRSLGIPSYLQTGGIVSPYYSIEGETWNGHLAVSSRGIGWHGWVEAYVPPWGWLPVDITYGYYLDLSDPMSSITSSAPVKELTIESEKYSHVDFVASTLRTMERIENSSLYIYIEENIYKDIGSSNLGGGIIMYFMIMALFFIAAVILVIVVFLLLKRQGTDFKL